MGNILGYARSAAGDVTIPDAMHRDIPGQTAELNRTGAIKVYCDIGPDGLAARPGLQALLAAAGAGDTVAVVGLDRLGRTVPELLATAVTLTERGIALLCLDEQIDTSSADGTLIYRLFAAIAQCERRLSVERTKCAAPPARPFGKRRGRPPLDSDKISAALSLVRSGMSPAAVARQLRLGRSTIYREVNRAGIDRVTSSRGA
jgi:DNA invertase Pin-like site-specific DNA recombinase